MTEGRIDWFPSRSGKRGKNKKKKRWDPNRKRGDGGQREEGGGD